ncbi:sulfite oxidase [Ramlibacter sp. USB13]|uniref:Sulfite oxidase n=1 Tax=Ramlibacter cellulosilyticus TaxID=2764187 RepID=A0A923MTJ4_9BURK|nr:sulfite oxidase [Ramlibacter cellulosilyticus]MBC5784988.1 sulfite oxidase [Ramlibacter cellulosilyticus]
MNSDRPTDLSRRGLLAGSATALAAASLGGRALAQAPAAAPPRPALPPYVAWKDAEHVIVHTGTTIETKRSAFGTSIITPAERLYIRNNLPAPDVSIVANRDAWVLSVEGVRQPRMLTVADLRTMGLETVAAVLQCSGNGRGYFASKPSGTKWQVGAAGCVIWSGVPVRNVVAALGGVDGAARFMTGTGGETLPAGVDPKSVMVERSVPLKAMEDALLAWEMNGEPVPHAHGGPLRLVVPGYSGVNNIKYVKRLAFTADESDAAIQRTGYRISPPGQKHQPTEPSVWEMELKSWINGPAPETGPVKAGWVQVHGVAMGATRNLRRVDVSIDGGQTWREARFVGPDLGRFAWRQFVLPVRLEPGQYLLASRAQDTQFNWQAESTPDNSGGYLNSGWRAHAIPLVVV